MKLIALTGKAGSGKDSVADILCREYGFVRYAFAKPLKDMLRAIGVDCDDRTTKENPHPIFGASPRKMAQTLGTEWMRDTICKDGWLRLAAQFIDSVATESPDHRQEGIVITDCRFPNEAAFVAERGGVIWHVERSDCPVVAAHSSESGLTREPGDLVLPNDTPGLDALAKTVRLAVESPNFFTIGWPDMEEK